MTMTVVATICCCCCMSYQLALMGKQVVVVLPLESSSLLLHVLLGSLHDHKRVLLREVSEKFRDNVEFLQSRYLSHNDYHSR